MAKFDEKISYKQIVGELKTRGLSRLYLLYGPEDYLREDYLARIKKLCLPEGEDDFSYRRLQGSVSVRDIADAVNAMPFMTERTLVEVRDFDFNKCIDEDADDLERIISDVPEWCTLVFVTGAQYEIDWRRKAAKSVKKHGAAVQFNAQGQAALTDWIQRRFAARGKDIDSRTMQHLIFTSGDLMNRLLPEIEKIADSVETTEITVADVERYAHHIPEAKVFDMTDRLGERNYGAASELLAELLASGEEPQKTLGAIGAQFRRLYAAKIASEERLGAAFLSEVAGIKSPYFAEKTMTTARRFTLSQLMEAVEQCFAAACAMNSSSMDDGEVLKELFIRLSVGGAA